MKHQHILFVLSALAVLAACKGEESDGNHLPALPEHFVSTTPLESAVDVKAVRESAKDGERVVLRGTVQEFGALATLRLVEDSLSHCGEGNLEDEHCSTPWDFCCEDPAALRRYTVNVEFLEGERPGAWRLRGAHGIDRLSEVTVAGVLHVDELGNMRLAADRIALQ